MHPTADRMPESSLGQMISWMFEEFGAGDSLCVADRKGVDIAPALEFLLSAESRSEAVCLIGTTAAFGALFDELRARRLQLSLSRGSRLMDTGGAKGQSVPLRPGQVVEQTQNPSWTRPGVGNKRIRDDRDVLADVRRDLVQFARLAWNRARRRASRGAQQAGASLARRCRGRSGQSPTRSGWTSGSAAVFRSRQRGIGIGHSYRRSGSYTEPGRQGTWPRRGRRGARLRARNRAVRFARDTRELTRAAAQAWQR